MNVHSPYGAHGVGLELMGSIPVAPTPSSDTRNAFDEILPASHRGPRLVSSLGERIDLRPTIKRVEGHLRAGGTTARSRVAVLSDPARPLDALAAYLATLACGLTPGLVRPSTPALEEHLRQHSFVAVAAGPDDLRSLGDRRDDREEDFVVFTSGSTARPKGVRYSLAGAVHNLAATQSYLRLTEADRLALPLPIHYIYGLSSLNLALRTGATVSLVDYRQPPVTWLKDLIALQPTVLCLVPHQARLLLRCDAFSAQHLRGLRCVTLAGGALAPAGTTQLLERFPGADIFLMYGQTEAGPRVSYVPPSSLPDHANSIGQGIAGYTRLRLADPADDGVSQLQVKSPSLMLGYLDRADPAPIDADGWLSTGDLAYIDADGFYIVVGRCAPFFKPFDERVSFREVLDAASEVMPDAAFRLATEADPVRGERLVLTATAAMAWAPEDQQRIRRAMRQRLGGARTPAKVVLVQRDEAAKLD